MVTILTALTAMTTFAQSKGTISGTIKDAQTGDPLPGATVQVQNTGLGASTDWTGGFKQTPKLPLSK